MEHDDERLDEDGDEVCDPTPLLIDNDVFRIWCPGVEVAELIAARFPHSPRSLESLVKDGCEGQVVSTSDYELYAFLVNSYHRGKYAQEEGGNRCHP